MSNARELAELGLEVDVNGNRVNLDTPLEVQQATATVFNDNAGNAVRLEYDGGPAQYDTGAMLTFAQNWYTESTDIVRTGGIAGIKTVGSGAFGGGLAFYAQPNSGSDMNQAMVLNHNGRLALGTDNPTGLLQLAAPSSGTVLNLQRTNTNTTGGIGTIQFSALDDHAVAAISALGDGDDEGAYLSFRTTSVASTNNWYTGTGERMKIDSEGHILIGTSVPSFGEKFKVENSGSTENCAFFHFSGTDNRAAVITQHNGSSGSTNREHYVFLNSSSSAVGSISASGSGTTYATTSDRRLKTDIQPITNGTEKLMAMNPVTHKWKADPHTGETVVGFIAQEMQEIVPEAVSGDPDGEEMMSMDYGRITPVLVAALQDAHKKIEALEERLAELEAK